MTESLSVNFDPLIAWGWLAALGFAAAVAWGVYLLRKGKAWLLRALGLLALGLGLANPMLVREQREPLADIALVVVDGSASMDYGARAQGLINAGAALNQRLAGLPDLEVRQVESPAFGEDTRLFETIETALADVPADRLAGVIVLTDGQVHDVPADLPEGVRRMMPGAPLHGLIVGSVTERDRRIALVNRPSFAILGEPSILRFIVEDNGAAAGEVVEVSLSLNGQSLPPLTVPVGVETETSLVMDRRGLNALGLSVPAAPEELSLANNTVALGITGVRDRLRVLLVTGEPYAGARVWRDLLKSDPSVDLVHFTILRPPNKTDFTPTEELSLIGFPTEELFDEKLKSFDLIIFDRYRRRGVLPIAYFENIVSYVEEGGALLISSGEAEAGGASLYRTPLAAVLPARPTGDLYERAFKPEPTDLGRRHAVTAPLAASRPAQGWGQWYRYVAAETLSGVTVLQAPDKNPLLVLDRVGQGRVAQVLSDQIWLWARGHDGGGPYAELVRRTAHWLMKEPELEEERLELVLDGQQAVLKLTSLSDAPAPPTLTGPDGVVQQGEWQTVSGTGTSGESASPSEDGFSLTLPAPLLGVYTATSGDLSAIAVNGAADSLELSDLRSSFEPLSGAVAATRGGLTRVGEGQSIQLPEFRRVGRGGPAADRTEAANWLGMRTRGGYAVADRTATPLWPGVIAAFLMLLILVLAWRREGR
jgi:hypothetical protein